MGAFRPILWVRGVLAGWDLHQSIAHPRHPNVSHYKLLPPIRLRLKAGTILLLLVVLFCSICRRLAAIPMSKYGPNSSPTAHPVLGVRVDLVGRNGTNRNVVPPFLFDFLAHYRPYALGPILHCLATTHNAADDRQSDRNMPLAWAAML